MQFLGALAVMLALGVLVMLFLWAVLDGFTHGLGYRDEERP